MDFSFTPDQLALRDGLREALKGLDDAPDAALAWSRLSDLGLPVALVPEADGGLGLDELDLVLCVEETGRAALPVPVVETCLVAPHLLTPAALGEPATVVLDGSDLAPWAGLARTALVGDRTAVRRTPALNPVHAVDPYRPLGRPTAPGERLDVDRGALDKGWRAGVLGTAAQLVGLGARAVELAVEHVRERHQFGVPVGSFQAVKHQLADGYRAVELARPLVHAAAWAQATGAPTAERDVSAAKARAGTAAGLAARAALQCHGAMGYTREHPLHRWLTRIWALQAAWGTGAEHREVVARALGLIEEDA
ncbi:acyl-CoA dehydrogenase family protein [Spongisporangium articulatum]|uniref:Acyl-CoA dehydrogenase family protein n=1 Tax=Spongisporangium articulatum TaxID=3362603 RepID=A0ABW8AVW9_9ACTN